MEIKFSQIVKKIKSDTALNGVDFIIPGAGVTGILGDYGSGKSTVLSLITGYLKPNSGEIFIDQRKINLKEVRDAVNLGIGSVDPDLKVYNKFTIRQNLLLNPHYKAKKQNQIESEFAELCKELNIPFDFDDLLGVYPEAIKLIFEIIRLYLFEFKLILLDEPYKNFFGVHKKQLSQVFELLKQQKDIQFVFSTRFKNEIQMVCDHCIVLENGNVAGQFTQPFQNLDEIYHVGFPHQIMSDVSDINLLSLIDFQVFPEAKAINYNLKMGEIVGVYSDVKEVAENFLLCCAGLHTAYSGELLLNGFDLFGRPLQEFVNDGVVFIAEDHLEGNLIPDMHLFKHFGLMGPFSEKIFHPLKFEEAAKKYLFEIGIKQDWNTAVKNLSKKDQIKFLFSILPRALSLLICVNPTAGLDQETKQWVWQEISLRAKSGVGVLVFCSNVEELQHNTHRIWLNQFGRWLEPIESSLLLSTLDQPLVPTPNSLDEDYYAAN